VGLANCVISILLEVLRSTKGYSEVPLFRGYPDVVDADLADYFGSIPHTDLLKSVTRRIVDRRVLHADGSHPGAHFKELSPY
jgi:retron-type reverse transcriptase